ncbi:hypothetical protein HY485_04130, partial [Candidatus Woesearchaeota archaeon]|nr:hypothetical protein [Candidatus Woesearchaeota archaeon]
MKLTPFGASVLGVILLLSIGFLGPVYITGNIINVEQVIQQAQQKTQKEMQQAQQTLPPTAQPLFVTALQQAQQKIDQNAQQWAQKITPTICKLVPQATSTESLVTQLMPQLERSMQSAVQQIITIVLKQNIIIQQNDPEAQQKISQAQTIANAAIKPLTTYGAQQILTISLKQCPKEAQPPSAADRLPETRQAQRAVSSILTQEPLKCNDSDGGKNFEQKGTTRGVRAWWEPKQENVYDEQDSCTTICQGSVGSGIKTEGPCLIEYYCDKRMDKNEEPIYAAFVSKKCDNGCKNGACIQQPAEQTPAQPPIQKTSQFDIAPLVSYLDETTKTKLLSVQQKVPVQFRVQFFYVLQESMKNIDIAIPDFIKDQQQKMCQKLQQADNKETAIQELKRDSFNAVSPVVQKLVLQSSAKLFEMYLKLTPAEGPQKLILPTADDYNAMTNAITFPLTEYVAQKVLTAILSNCQLIEQIPQPMQQTPSQSALTQQILQVNVEQLLFQLDTATKTELLSAQQKVPAQFQSQYWYIVHETMNGIEQNVFTYVQSEQQKMCQKLRQADNKETTIQELKNSAFNALSPNVNKMLSQQVAKLISFVLSTPADIQQKFIQTQPKAEDYQTMINVAVLPLTQFGAQKIVTLALTNCPKEQLPPSAADTILQTQRVAPALSTQPTRTERAGTVSTAFESQPQTGEGPISGGGIGQGPQQGIDVGLKDVLFYYEDAMSMWVDKDKLEPRTRISPSVMAKNSGTVEAKNVEISVSVDGGTEDKKIIQTLPAGGASGYGFFLPAGLEGGKHELTIRFTAKDDINPANDVVKVPFTILVDGALKNIRFVYIDDRRSVLPITVDTNAVDPTRNLVATVYASNEGRATIQKADVGLSVDNTAAQRQTIYGASRDVSFDIKGLAPGKHDLAFFLDLKGDTNPSNDAPRVSITIAPPTQPQQPAAPQPTPPAVEQPKPQLPDIVLELPRQDWLEQDGKFLKPNELKTEEYTSKAFFGMILVNNKGTKPARNVIITTTIDGEEVDKKTYDEIGLNPPVSYGTSGTYNAYTYSFGSGIKKLWPGKHQLKIIATTTDQEISKTNNEINAELLITDTKGSTAPPQAQGDIRAEKIAFAQYSSTTKDYEDLQFGPVGKIVDERYETILRVYPAKDSPLFTFEIFIDGKKPPIKSVGGASRPSPNAYQTLGQLTPGKYHLKVVLDPDNHVYETNENNNVFETDFWVKETPKDINLETVSTASFNDANAKQKGKNTIDLSVQFTATGRVPPTVPVKIQYGDKTETKTLTTNMPATLPQGGIYWKQNVQYFELPADRNKFPTNIYVSAEYPEDENKNDNTLIVPVIILKDRKYYS